MKLKVRKNRRNVITMVVVGAIFLLLPLLVMVITKDKHYSRVFFKILEVVIIASSIIYTYFVFSKQIKLNAMFGITRRETRKQWATKIVIIGLYVLVLNILNGVVSYLLIPGEHSKLYMSFYMGLAIMEGFYCFYILNYLVYFVLTKNICEKTKKGLVIMIFIIGLVICVSFSFLIFIPTLLDSFLYNFYLGDVFVGPGVFILGLLLMIFAKKGVYKGEY